jgi:hypothetical protein
MYSTSKPSGSEKQLIPWIMIQRMRLMVKRISVLGGMLVRNNGSLKGGSPPGSTDLECRLPTGLVQSVVYIIFICLQSCNNPRITQSIENSYSSEVHTKIIYREIASPNFINGRLKYLYMTT